MGGHRYMLRDVNIGVRIIGLSVSVVVRDERDRDR